MGLGSAGVAAGRDIAVLVECDTGGARNGVQTPEAAAKLAQAIDRTKGVDLWRAHDLCGARHPQDRRKPFSARRAI